MDTLNIKLQQAALSISVKHLLHSQKQSPGKTAEQLLKLYCEAYGLKDTDYRKHTLLTPLTERLSTEDAGSIISWLNHEFTPSSI